MRQLLAWLGMVAPEPLPVLGRLPTGPVRLGPHTGPAYDQAVTDGRAIRCPDCGFVSFHPRDVEAGWCGNCHAYTTARLHVCKDFR